MYHTVLVLLLPTAHQAASPKWMALSKSEEFICGPGKFLAWGGEYIEITSSWKGSQAVYARASPLVLSLFPQFELSAVLVGGCFFYVYFLGTERDFYLFVGSAAFVRRAFPAAWNASSFCTNDTHDIGLYILYFTRNKFYLMKVDNCRENLQINATLADV